MRTINLIFSVLLLCSCSHFEEDKQQAVVQAKADLQTIQGNVTHNAKRVANEVRDNIKLTNDRVRDWWITPLPSTQPLAMPSRYCYRVLQDVLCYREAVPGWEGKLVGYQGYKATPPAVVATQPLPLRDGDDSSLAVNRVVNMQPVFVGMSTAPKDKNAATNNTVDLDAPHETLPESPLAPQL